MKNTAHSAANLIGGGFAPKLFGTRAVLENQAGSESGSPPAAAAPAAPTPSPTPAPSPPAAAALPVGSVVVSESELTALRSRIQALEPLETEVRTYRDRDAQELASIEARKASLNDAQKAALDAASGVAGKRAVLALIDSTAKPATPAPPPMPTATPPSPDAPIDFAAAFADADRWAAAKAKNPQGAAAWFNAQLAGGRKESTIERLRGSRSQ